MNSLNLEELQKARAMLEQQPSLYGKFVKHGDMYYRVNLPAIKPMEPRFDEPKRESENLDLTYSYKVTPAPPSLIIKDAIIDLDLSYQDYFKELFLKFLKANPYPYKSKKKRLIQKWVKKMFKKWRRICEG